jgi:kanamycin kinase
VTAIGQGLRALHDALPVRDCPFSWSAAGRLADARRRAGLGLLTTDQWHPSHRHLSLPGALDLLEDVPPVDQLVVCHGDSCAPNTLLTDDGRWSGHVDLGALGVADRWADLAVATWSATWNYGPGWEPVLLEAYGVAPDPDRTRYYRLLWDQEP